MYSVPPFETKRKQEFRRPGRLSSKGLAGSVIKIFDKDGLTHSRDIDTYTSRLLTLRDLIDEKNRTYFDGKLLPLLNKHVIEPRRQNKIPPNWTNNNSESANHILKQATHWKLTDLPTLIKMLYKIVESEQEERSRAIRGMGSFQMVGGFLHHQCDVDHWARLTEEQQDRRTAKFLKDKGKPHPNATVSSDGSRIMQVPASAGKKKGQRKRPRADRTRTPTQKGDC